MEPESENAPQTEQPFGERARDEIAPDLRNADTSRAWTARLVTASGAAVADRLVFSQRS